MSAPTTSQERAAQRRAEWIAARLSEAPPLNAGQQHVIRRAFAGTELREPSKSVAA